MQVFGFSDRTTTATRTLGFHLTMVIWSLCVVAIAWALWWYVGGIWLVFLGLSLCVANKIERRVAKLWGVHRAKIVRNELSV